MRRVKPTTTETLASTPRPAESLVYADLPCPECEHRGSRVIDSRGSKGHYIRRRRECLKCQHRYTTREMVTDELASRPFVERRLSYIENAIARLRDDLNLDDHKP